MDLKDILREMDADDDDDDDDGANGDASMDAEQLQQISSSLRLGSGIGDISMDLNDILQTLSDDENDAVHAGHFAAERGGTNTTTTTTTNNNNNNSKLLRPATEKTPLQEGLFEMDGVNWENFLDNYHNQRTAAASQSANGERKRVVRFRTHETVHNYSV